MALVSGRPISFQMDLYQPLFVSRPVVEPELFASLRPPTYNGAMERGENKGEAFGAAAASAPTARALAGKAGDNQKQVREQALLFMKEQAIDPRRGINSSAVATELGDFFQYAIENPVTLPRQKSALLPIVNQDVEGSKVSIYNQNVHAKFPLLGLKFKNSTPLHLMQGPITVFENNSYAGDARILDLQPKEERLISYAIDLGTEVEPVVHNPQDRITKIKVNKGIIQATHLVRQEKTYNVKNRSEHDRTLLIEHPYRAEFKLMAPEKFSERARDVYRFEVPVAAGKNAKLDVTEERDVVQTVSLSNSDDQTMRFFISQNVTSDKVKTAINQAIALKSKLTSTQQDIQHKERRQKDIRDDQARLRANLKEVPPTSEAYKRYVKKFDDQETELEQLQADIKKLQDQEYQQRKTFESYLGSLDVE
jgi:hypothetical protein